MGAVSGLAVGIAQGATLGNAKRMLGWSAATAALWALGWTVTTAGGIDVEPAVGRVRRLRLPSRSPSCRAPSSARSFRPRVHV